MNYYAKPKQRISLEELQFNELTSEGITIWNYRLANGNIVSTTIFEKVLLERGVFIYVKANGIREPFQGRGIGKQLIELVNNRILTENAVGVLENSINSMEHNPDFYKFNGWKHVGIMGTWGPVMAHNLDENYAEQLIQLYPRIKQKLTD